MTLLLSIGLPITHLLVGLFASRFIWRSRHKHFAGSSICRDFYDGDTQIVCFFAIPLWPVVLPGYVLTSGGVHKKLKRLGARFYNHNLPEPENKKKARLALEKAKADNRIHELEYELGYRTDAPKRVALW